MRAEEIRDAESLQAWLESLPQETEAERETARRWAVTIAHRAVMRMIPFLVLSDFASSEYHAMQTLFAFRSCLVSQVLSRRKLPEHFDLDAVHMSNATNIVKGITRFKLDRDPLDGAAHLDAKTSRAAIKVYNAATWLVAIADGEIDNPQKLADAVQLAAGDLGYTVMTAITSDAIALTQEKIVVELSIWEASKRPIQIWQDAKNTLLHMGEGWRFWVEWYENALYGRPQDYDLLTKIALIDPTDWDKGADHVNALIQQIVEQHSLAKDARALKEEIAQLKERLQSVEHRSHNNPPELVDETAAAQKEVTIIWAALDEAEQELEKPDPDPSVLARIGAFLKTAAVSVAKYCAVLSDVAVKASVGLAAATGTAKALAAQSDQLRAFGEALLQFAKILGAF